MASTLLILYQTIVDMYRKTNDNKELVDGDSSLNVTLTSDSEILEKNNFTVESLNQQIKKILLKEIFYKGSSVDNDRNVNYCELFYSMIVIFFKYLFSSSSHVT